VRFCQPHWDELREAIRTRKLDHLVPKSGEEAVERLKDELEGNPDQFDPLMAAHNMVVGNAMNILGLSLFTGDLCPLCEVEKAGKEEGLGDGTASGWVTASADGVLSHCREHNLLRPEN
jgi:hypothetical protein